MKTKHKLLGILAMGILFSACSKFNDDINTNTNKPTIASGTKLIANSELSLQNISSNAYGNLYPQYLATTTFPEDARYATVYFNFYTWYAEPLINLETVINSSSLNLSEGAIINQIAVAKILKAYFMWHMTDRWGDLPYSQALMGKDLLNPAYDKQQAIYTALFKLLDDANASINIGAGNIKNDLMYYGDMTKWKKFGNTVHMLMALRLSKVDKALGTAEFNKALNNGVIDGNDQNFTFRNLAEEVNENFWYTSFTTKGRKWYAVSKQLIDRMQPYADPRLKIYADKNLAGNYVGLDYGLSESVAVDKYSLLGAAIRQQNSPVYLVTYAQVLFAKAEAAKMNWIGGGDATAETNYKMAIEQSVRQWNNDDISGLPAFMANADITYNAAKGLEQIATQRWVHLFMNGYEAWAEWRRTGLPVLNPPANLGKPIPRREGYPTQERLANKNNYNAAVAAFPYGGTDDLNARVWWDKP
jgi:hypothetical protein